MFGTGSGQGGKDVAVAKAQQTKVQPWVEKYRPQGVDDISYQDEVVKTLKNAIQTGTLPHLLFYGPPGTGKTSTILAVARSLFGPEYRSRILELNASDERGIKVVREKVKQFAQFTVTGLEKTAGYPCPPFKIIILDEADTMTTEAQAALRRTMETYSKITRFCLVCNYVTRIIEPLASRCAKFRFRPLSREVMEARLRAIGAAEGASVTQEMMDAILTVADGCVLTFFPSPSFPPCLPPSPSSLSGGFPLVPPRRFIS
ncbi:dna replication factor c subunit [Nannochloropsis gaditana]|uniref:Dna replication factor c subunit n=1 Tax=Nannochloropsis gaditana TaxID=72520 RepID=W7TMJ2_9STRA|nr:dna replication factor c subunit [Nannochloropsis gaditana]